MATRNFAAFLDAHNVEVVTVCSMKPKPALLAKKTWHAVRRLLSPYINTPSTCPSAFKPLHQLLEDWDSQYTVVTSPVDQMDDLSVVVTRVKRAPKRPTAECDSGSEVSPRKIPRPASIKVEAEYSGAADERARSALADERARCAELRGQNAALTSEISELKKDVKKIEAACKKSDERVVVLTCEQQHTANVILGLRKELQGKFTSLVKAEEVIFPALSRNFQVVD
jgi:hypothetical protein